MEAINHLKTVCIVQRYLMHYRVPLFERMRSELCNQGIQLRLIHGKRANEESKRKDEGTLDWAECVPEHVLRFGGTEAIWQPIRRLTKECDLVILPQHNRFISNWFLLLHRGKRKIGLWGHGRKFQESTSFRHYLRSRLACLPDWWFAYTASSREAVVEAGFPVEKITVLNNSIDTAILQKDIQSIQKKEIEQIREELGLQGATAVFCSSLHAGKRIGFLLEAAYLIREQVPGFQLIIIGGGPDEHLVEQAAQKHNWIHWKGVLFGREKMLYLCASDCFLMPYFIGLSVVDAFCSGLPVFALKSGNHSPEVAYISDGENGRLIEPATAKAYAEAVAGYFNNRVQVKQMKSHALKSSELYTLEGMVQSFVTGIVSALDD